MHVLARIELKYQVLTINIIRMSTKLYISTKRLFHIDIQTNIAFIENNFVDLKV